MVKIVGKISEENRISVRNARRDANDLIKKHQNENDVSKDDIKRWLHNIQELTDNYIKKINSISDNKENEISI